MAANFGTVFARAGQMIVRVQLWVSMAALVTMMMVVVTDVALRQFFNHPVQGAYDAVSILLGISVFYALGAVIAGRNEIVIDLIDSMLPARVVRFLKRIAGLMSALVLTFIFFAMLTPMQEAYRYGDISLELRIPLWIVWVAALIGMLGGIIASIMMQFSPREPGGMHALDAAGGHAE